MVEFFCPHCKQNTLDSFAVGFAHNRVLKCDFCMNKFRVSIVAVEHSVQADVLEWCGCEGNPPTMENGKCSACGKNAHR